MVENSGTIIADGGEVYLTTNAVNELLKGVVNNTGIIEANSLDGLTGKVELFAHGGTAEVGGTIEAKDGFVETSGRKLDIKDDINIKANTWLLDPYNLEIVSDDTETILTSDGGNGMYAIIGSEDNSKVKASTIEAQLNNESIEVIYVSTHYDEVTEGTQEGNIYVNASISWDSDTALALVASNNIYINKSITATNNSGKLGLYYGQGSTNGTINSVEANYYVNAPINLKAGENFYTKLGSNGTEKTWTVVTTATDMQAMELRAETKNYALGANLTLSGVNNWIAIGNYTDYFQGTFDGLGHTVSNLNINKPEDSYQGLFGHTNLATIKNIGVVNASIIGYDYVGGLVGNNFSSTISNSYSTGTVTGGNGAYVGGLVGNNFISTISNSYSSSKSVIGGTNAALGGLTGNNTNGTVTNSYYDKTANTGTMADANAYGKTTSELMALAKDKWSSDIWSFGGGKDVEGYEIALSPYLKGVTATADKNTITLFNGGMGVDGNAYTITNWTQLQNINNTAIVSGDYHFDLSNSIDKDTSDYIADFNPIGDNTNKFVGTFDGLGNTISNISISTNGLYAGMFGYTGTDAVIKNVALKDVSITSKRNSSGWAYAGGLVAYNKGTVSNTFATGEVKSEQENSVSYVYGAGLVGANYGTLEKSYSLVSVKMDNEHDNSSYGLTYNNSSVINSFYDKELVTGMPDENIYGKTTNELQQINTYEENADARWNMSSSSTMSSEYLYPILVTENGVTSWRLYQKAVTITNPTVTNPTAPSTKKDTDKIITAITNTTAVKVVAPRVAPAFVPQRVVKTTIAPTIDMGFGEGTKVSLVSKPLENEPTKMITMTEIKAIQPQSTQSENGGGETTGTLAVQETRVSLSQDSIVDLINGGVNLPNGVEQQFFVVADETLEN